MPKPRRGSNQPLGTIKTRIRSGLHKLQQAMSRGSGKAMSTSQSDRCGQSELTCAYAAQALAASDIAAAEAHIASCPDCRRELEILRPVFDRFVSWPTDVLRPTTSLQERLAQRIAEETGQAAGVAADAALVASRTGNRWRPGSNASCWRPTAGRHRVSMLVRLAPGASYPAHTHAGRGRAVPP